MLLYRTVHNAIFNAAKSLTRKGLYEFLDREFEKIEERASVLTIGSGGKVNELLALHAEKNDFDVVSLDIDESRGPDIVGDICTHDFGGQTFDAIVISEVLEHVYAPHVAVDNMHAWLNGNGRLILTVPFIFPLHERPHDYYRYTRYGLEYLLREFEDVCINERNSWAEAINVLPVRFLESGNTSARIVGPILLFAALLARPFAILLGNLFKSDFLTTGYTVTAVKK